MIPDYAMICRYAFIFPMKCETHIRRQLDYAMQNVDEVAQWIECDTILFEFDGIVLFTAVCH